MSALIIHGRLGDDLWIERDGYLSPVTDLDVANMRRIIQMAPVRSVTKDGTGIKLDESDVDALIRALTDAPELDPCVRCRTLPILHGGEHCIECAGIVQDQSDATMRIARLA